MCQRQNTSWALIKVFLLHDKNGWRKTRVKNVIECVTVNQLNAMSYASLHMRHFGRWNLSHCKARNYFSVNQIINTEVFNVKKKIFLNYQNGRKFHSKLLSFWLLLYLAWCEFRCKSSSLTQVIFFSLDKTTLFFSKSILKY